MTDSAAFEACEATVRKADPDRYFASLFAPADARPALFALYALNHELAHVGETVHQPMLADIRFEWWREGVEGALAGRPRGHDVLKALAEVFARTPLPLQTFETMIAARGFDAGTESFADMDALERYADATAGHLMRLAVALLGATDVPSDLIVHAGQAYALIGLLRSLPFHAAHGKQRLPQELVQRLGEAGAKHEILSRARAHWRKAHAYRNVGAALPALLPAALVPLYAKHLTRNDKTDVAQFRKQWTLLKAAMRGRV